MKEFYPDELTEKSFEELAHFVNFMKMKGHIPLIVGGWAVYAYTKGLGSRDIDVVFQNAHTRDNALLGFFKAHSYEEKKVDTFGFTKQLVKKIKVDKREEEIFVDACTAKDVIPNKNLSTVVKWEWASKDNRKILVDTLDFYVPNSELLIVYKMLAAIGRASGLVYAPEEKKDYIKAKIWKDYYDIFSLIKNCKFNHSEVLKYLKKANAVKHLNSFAKEIVNYKDVLNYLDMELEEVNNFIAKLEDGK